jgi:hypothetical protein
VVRTSAFFIRSRDTRAKSSKGSAATMYPVIDARLPVAEVSGNTFAQTAVAGLPTAAADDDGTAAPGGAGGR